MSEIRLADYLARRLADAGLDRVFLLSGGGAMHLNDAFGGEPRLKYVCCHHEQACSMAAEGYARIAHKPAILNVTTGPGGINSLNGVFGAFTDSLPMVVISGQVKRETLIRTYHLEGVLRQLGDQEVDFVHMAKYITKYAVCIDDPQTIRYHLERALYLAVNGRPGPVWVDVPVDVQSSKIDPAKLKGYDPKEDQIQFNESQIDAQCRELAERLKKAERPVFMLGSGIHLANAYEKLEAVIRKIGAPVTTAWTAIDLLDSNDPLYCGRPGVVGDRAGNFCIQNSDLVIVLGCRLPIRQVSYNWQSFARHAFKVQVDIDNAELEKPVMVRPDMPIHADVGMFLDKFLSHLGDIKSEKYSSWVSWCKKRLAMYPVVQDRQRNPDKPINPYHFFEVLSQYMDKSDVVACGDASASVMSFQAVKIKYGQRIFTNAGSASMGYDLPSAVGAAIAQPNGRVICLAGEGSLMLNLQELQTVAHHQLPVKIVIINNGGYLSIRSTQKNFFNRLVGEGPESGVTFPDFVQVGKAFGLPSVRIENPGFEKQLKAFLDAPGPGIADVIVDREQGFEPKLSSRVLPDGKMATAALEDMAPFLDRAELQSNLFNA
jgi:acetolactate synthase-1/2/3 large subunit